MKLGTLLLRDGVINLDQLEAALRAQVLFGGRLGTNLVELGHLSLDTLTAYLAKTLGLPAASQAMFELVEPAALALVPAALAAEQLALPLGVDPHAPGTLKLAIADPRRPDTITAIERVTGLRVAPHVAPELRILFYLERVYGVARSPRFVRAAPTSTATTAMPPSGERRRFVEGELPPTPVSIQPRRSTAPPLRPSAAPSPSATADPHAAAAEAATPPAPKVVAPARPIGLADTLARLDAAASRDAIGATIMDFARARFEVAVIFVLKDGLALGWRGEVPGLDAGAIERLSLPLAGASCLASAYEYRLPWRGAPGVSGKSLDPTLLMRLRRPAPPDEVLTAPVVIGKRVVNLLYVQAHAGAALDDGLVDAVVSVVDAAGEAYARLIQTAKARPSPNPA